MKKRFVLILFVLSIKILSLRAQSCPKESDRKNTIFFELGGNGLNYSLNYDRILFEKKNWKIAGRVGLMYFNNKSYDFTHRYSLLPIEVSQLLGKNNKYFELGLGITTGVKTFINHKNSFDYKSHYLYMVPALRIGYRYQKEDGGLFFKCGYLPLLFKIFEINEKTKRIKNYNVTTESLNWFGLAVGYTFKNKKQY